MGVSADASLSVGEQAFLQALVALNVHFLLVGMSAALLQGVRGTTEGLHLWFQDIDDPRVGEATQRAGGFWVDRLGRAFKTPMSLTGDTTALATRLDWRARDAESRFPTPLRASRGDTLSLEEALV